MKNNGGTTYFLIGTYLKAEQAAMLENLSVDVVVTADSNWKIDPPECATFSLSMGKEKSFTAIDTPKKEADCPIVVVLRLKTEKLKIFRKTSSEFVEVTGSIGESQLDETFYVLGSKFSSQERTASIQVKHSVHESCDKVLGTVFGADFTIASESPPPVKLLGEAQLYDNRKGVLTLSNITPKERTKDIRFTFRDIEATERFQKINKPNTFAFACTKQTEMKWTTSHAILWYGKVPEADVYQEKNGNAVLCKFVHNANDKQQLRKQVDLQYVGIKDCFTWDGAFAYLRRGSSIEDGYFVGQLGDSAETTRSKAVMAMHFAINAERESSHSDWENKKRGYCELKAKEAAKYNAAFLYKCTYLKKGNLPSLYVRPQSQGVIPQ